MVPATPGTLSSLNNTGNQDGCSANDSAPIASGGCGCYSDSATAAGCEARCQAMGPAKCKSFAWSGGPGTAHWGQKCCIHADDVWNPKSGSPAYADHVSGRWVGATSGKNVWKAVLPSSFSEAESPQFRVNGARSTRARYPNSNPETEYWPTVRTPMPPQCKLGPRAR